MPAKPMLAPADSIRSKMKCPCRLLFEQLNRKLHFHSRPQKRRRQENIYKAAHDSRRTLRLISETMHRAQRMVQSRSRLERHVGSRTQADEFDHALRSRKLVGHFAARPDLGPSSALGYCRNVLAANRQRNLEISRELCRDDSRQPRDF